MMYCYLLLNVIYELNTEILELELGNWKLNTKYLSMLVQLLYCYKSIWQHLSGKLSI
jgi:hypothetical protein